MGQEGRRDGKGRNGRAISGTEVKGEKEDTEKGVMKMWKWRWMRGEGRGGGWIKGEEGGKG